ncbi:MAG: RraA family protein [Bryobacter sp.]|nr:RraA family protein [Bryobacter sp. CoA8 C33]
MSGREQIELITNHLYTAVISDSLDSLGYRHQVMREYIRPVHSRYQVVAGFAHTIQFVDSDEVLENPFDAEIEAVDAIAADAMVVIATGLSVRNAPWGELLSTAAVARGARGAVMDGFVRDVKLIEELGFPVFATGMKPVDSNGRGKLTSWGQPVLCGEVTVAPGDLVVADFDGVIAIPAGILEPVLAKAREKVNGENQTRAELRAGAYLRDVYAKYGVL